MLGVFIFSVICIALLFFGYPLFLYFCSKLRAGTDSSRDIPDIVLPSLTVLVAVRDGEALIAKKVQNSLELDYPKDRLEVVAISDGSSDKTVSILKDIDDPRFRFYHLEQHKGKQEALNVGMSKIKSDIVLFSDADAILNSDAAKLLVRHFSDTSVGGVGGQRLILDAGGAMKGAQKSYIRIDSQVKILESQSGSTTSNDGKIYAIRRELFKGVAEAVTDDLYVCLSVLGQGRRFQFEPLAKAYIVTPSRDSKHEISRRRRIVNRSLRGIWLNRKVLNPVETSWQIAIGLFINKVIRRMLPFILLIFVASTGLLAIEYPLMLFFFVLQVAVIAMAMLYPALIRLPNKIFLLSRISSLAYYFSVGNLGTLLGVVDFLRGQRPVRWDPKKTG